MDYLQAIVLGIVEGITEYLPVSSTFHLIWMGKFLGIANTDFQKAFEVIIQAGAIFAVALLYWKRILTNRQLVNKVLVAFIPTVIVGLVLYKLIKNFFFDNSFLQLSVFILIGLTFILFEKYKGKNLSKNLATLTYRQSLTIGLIQSLAVIPGVSRAGAVILGLMFLGIRRDEAAVFSFLLAIPTLLAASGLDLVKTWPTLTSSAQNIGLLAVGFVTSFLSALVFVRWFISFFQKHSLESFGWYRIMLGIFLLLTRGLL